MKFKFGDKVRVIDIGKAGLPIGTKAKVIEVVDNDGVFLDKINTNGLPSYYSSNKVELIKSKNQRIKALEEKVAKQGEEIEELKLIIAKIRKPSTVITKTITIPSIVEDKPKSPNQLRAEIIEKAKGFVEENLKKNHPNACYDKMGAWLVSEGGFITVTTKIDFVVNDNKRTIVALIRCESGEIRGRGIAKCMPGDVYNEYIGKAIALGRALGLDVSEFEQAVQPTIAVGQITNDGEVYAVKPTHRTRGEDAGKPFLAVNEGYTVIESYGYERWLPIELAKIINDTNVIYGGVE